MQRPEQHEIDEAARRVLKNALPTAWIRRPQSPDYGIDYQYEIVDSGKVTGLSFAVQLKGKKSIEPRNQAVAYQLETRHLKYYVDDQRYPVFLVLVDTAQNRGWWLFLQGYAINQLSGVDWRSKESIVVHVPTENEITKIDVLRHAVESADRMMAELRPAAVQGAIVAERKRMESLDPRIQIGVTATEGASHYQLTPIEPVTFRITFKGEKVSNMVEDLIDRGLPVDVKAGDVEVKGSALLEEGMNEKPFKIQLANKRDGVVRLSSIDKNGQEIAFIEPFSAKIEGGKREFRLNAQLPHAPLSISLKLELPKERVKTFPGFGKLDFSLNRWAGQRILQLAYFDQIHSLILAQCSGCELNIRCTVNGNELFSVRGKSTEIGFTREKAYAAAVLKKAREIALWISQNPSLPRDLNLTDLETIEDLHWKLESGDRTRPGAGTRLGVEFSRENVEGYLASSKDLGGVAIKVANRNEIVNFLGKEVETGPVEYELTDAKIEQTDEQLRAELHVLPPKESFKLTWIGGAKSELIVHRPSRIKGNEEVKLCDAAAVEGAQLLDQMEEEDGGRSPR